MTRIVIAGLAATLLALLANAGPVEAARNKAGGIITCTYDNCMKVCLGHGTRPGSCQRFCSKAINDRKASGECK